MNDEILNREFFQNCGDTLKVLEKSTKKKNNAYLYRCKFIKYPYEIFVLKQKILNGSVNNPQIEQVEFIDKIWPQNCGDSLRIIEKTNISKNFHYLFRCQFQKYPYEVLVTKKEILLGTVVNPQIEIEEFVNRIWPQNCGDSLKIIKKTNKKKGTNYLWEVEFQKYFYKTIVPKDTIINGTVLNPLIEENEFIGKIFPQNCGDNLKVLKKIDNQKYICEFQKYPYIIESEKSPIIKKEVDNPNLPWKTKKGLENFIKNNFENKPTITQIAKILNKSNTTISSAIINFNLRDKILYYKSIIEENFRDFIKQFRKDVLSEPFYIKNNNNYYEIDIYIPNLKFGVEYNGNLWHSNHPKYGKINSNYHQEKSLLAQEKGIKLIHIFEYEWEVKEEILKSLIKSNLGIFKKKIFARKCQIKEIKNYKEYAYFCEENHLQGSAGAKIKLGLYYEDELVQIMSFSLPRFTSDYEWEIIRECSKLGYQIIGGKERLWKYFIKNYNPKNCISYCDFSKFTGNSYLKLGFKKERLNKPGFVWWDEKTNQIFWRNPFKNQEMKDKGYLKIYDCGQLVFTWFNNL